jgi:hypothetical protein
MPNGPEIPALERVSADLARPPKVRKVHQMVGDVGHEVLLVAH